MKAQIKIYGHDYEIEIKARDTRNLNASKKATEKVTQWLLARLYEARRDQDREGYNSEELINVINSIYKNK